MIIFLAVVLLGGVTLLVLNTDWFRIKRLNNNSKVNTEWLLRWKE